MYGFLFLCFDEQYIFFPEKFSALLWNKESNLTKCQMQQILNELLSKSGLRVMTRLPIYVNDFRCVEVIYSFAILRSFYGCWLFFVFFSHVCFFLSFFFSPSFRLYRPVFLLFLLILLLKSA